MADDDVYVWVWLPGATEPVPAGLIRERRGGLSFRYGGGFLDRPEAANILYSPRESIEPHNGWYEPTENLGLPAALRDASPDNWGRRVIINRIYGDGAEGDTALLGERDYLLHSGSNRLGNLDFQSSGREYVPRSDTASLDELYNAAEFVEAGTPLPPNLAQALMHGTAIGGARPKALLTQDGKDYIAKFSTADDTYDVVGAEATSIHLARRVGIPVTDAHVTRSMGRKALILERFDRPGDGTRRGVVSALTMLGLPETFMPIGSYPEMLDQLRMHSSTPEGLGEQLFRRIAFNIVISNTDDHLRNHAAFWDGRHLDLTPAYDLSPVRRSGEVAGQALAYGRKGERESNLAKLVEHGHHYDLTAARAREVAHEVVAGIRDGWGEAADRAELTAVDRSAFLGRLFLNPGALHGLE